MGQFVVSAATASSVNGSNVADWAFDDQVGATRYWWASGYAPQWVRADLGAGNAAAATWYSVSPYPGDTYPPSAWTFEGSNDGSSWTVLDTRSGVVFPEGSRYVLYSFTNATAYRYYRLNVSAPTTTGGGVGIAIAEVRIGNGSPNQWLWEGVAPTTVLSGGFTVGVVFKPTKDGTLTDFLGLPASTAAVNYYLYDSSGTVVASRIGVAGSAGHWLRVPMTAPVAVTAGTYYMVTAWYPDSSYYVNASIAPDLTYGDLIIPGNGTVTFDGSTNSYRYANASDTKPTLPAGGRHLVGVAFEAVSTVPTVSAAAASTSTSTLTTAGTVARVAAAALVATSVLAAAPTAEVPVAAATSATSTLTAISGGLTVSAAASEATSTLQAVPTLTQQAAAAGDSTSVLQALAALEAQAAAGSTNTSTLAASLVIPDVTTGAASSSATSVLVADATIVPGGWVADLTGRALLGVTTSTTGLYVPPPVATPPGAVTPVAITSYCQVIEPADATHPVRALVEPDETVVGVPHVWVDGVDRTWTADGELCRIDNLTSEAGYGDRTAKLTVHGMEIWNKATGDPAFAWLHRGARVEAGVVAPDGTRHVWWSGDLASTSGSSRGKDFARTYDCTGPALAMARAKHQPLDTLDPTDVGVIWAQIRNGVNSAPYAKVKPVRTGITTRKRGAFGQSEAEYERDILATAWSGARPWRPVKSATNPRLYELRLIDTTAVHWTVTAGAHGVDVDVDEDWTANPNRIFGRGRLNNGYWWSNSKFPGFLPYQPPPYPFNDPDRQLFVGTTDADTDTGNGVSVFQRRLQELGYAIAVDGVMNTSDTAIVRKVQADLGLQVDGIAAGQTWTGVWAVGAAAADLSRVRRPLASDPRVEPWLYQANGAIAGPNPAYDPAWPCVEEDIEYGENTSLELGIRDAQERITRFALTAPRTGRITLRTDPREGSRYLIDECDNILVLGWEGEDVLFHIADIERDLAGGTVTLTVDSAFRDALTVKQIRDRNSESAPDPARKPGAIGRTRGTTTPDVATPFDGQSVAGKLPPLTIFGGLWSVWPIPFCKVGALARVYAETHDPTEFALLFFGQEVVPAQLQHGIGNPLAASRPWSDEQINAWLTAHGFIDGWGHQDQPAGYGSGSKSDGDPLLGWLLSSSSVPFFAPQAVIWAAVISAAPCEISIDMAPQAGE